MWESVAVGVMTNLIPYFVTKWVDGQQENEITEAKITEEDIKKLIQEELDKREEIKKEEIVIADVLNKVEELSRQLNYFKVENNQIIFFLPNPETEKQFDQQELITQLIEQLNALAQKDQQHNSPSELKTESTTESPSPSEDEELQILEMPESDEEENLEPPLYSINPEPLPVNGTFETFPEDPSSQRVEVTEAENPPPKTQSSPTGEVEEPENPPPKEKKKQEYLEELSKYEKYANSITKALTSFQEKQSLPDEVKPKLDECLRDLENKAKETILSATSPVKIAIMGEVSSGKTLLLGSLIGYGDALPVSEVATTGNVTAIHLVQQEEPKTTKVNQFKVEYLSEEMVKDCVEYMLSEAETRAKAADISLTELQSLQKLKQKDSVDWDGILQWCEQTWKQNANVQLRYLISELVVFARSYETYGTTICGKEYEIDHTIAKEGLKLPGTVKVLESDFSSLPPEPPQWQNINQPSESDLQNSFSLIRRIDVTVEVSKTIWNLSSLKGSNEFVLLDLPGLGAESSGVRDTFLSLSEIKEVQTFLLLLDARASSPGNEAQKIRTMIENEIKQDIKDRIIVGVGRFNQLSLNEANKQEIDKLIDEERDFEPNFEEVTNNLDILEQIITSAENLTSKKENILLLSQTFGLAELQQNSRLVQVCSPEFQPELDKVNKSDSEESKLRHKWEKLSEIMPEDEANQTLKRQLRDFADDGGIGRLRLLLQNHVAEHGLKQLHDDTRSTAQELGRKQKNLKRILEEIVKNPIADDTPAYTNLRKAIEFFRTTYQNLREDLKKQSLLKYNRVPVSDVVKEELSFRIHRWNEWNVLFNNIQEGIIIKPPSHQSSTAVRLGRKSRKQITSIPTKSDDFYLVFEKTFQELKDFALDCTKKALQELLSELSDKTKDQLQICDEILRPEMEEEIQQKFRDEDADLFYNVKTNLDPNQWYTAILQEEDYKEINSQTMALFPLAIEDDEHQIGHFFDWSQEQPSSASPIPFNHEFLVLRLRSEMIASAGLRLVDYVSQLTEKANTQLDDLLNVALNQDLLPLSQNEPLLRYIATGEEQSKNPLWWQTLYYSIALISDSSL